MTLCRIGAYIGDSCSFVVALVFCLTVVGNGARLSDTSPLSKDAVAIYGKILERYGDDPGVHYNVRSTTYILDAKHLPAGLEAGGECLPSFRKEDLDAAAKRSHDLPAGIVPVNMKLVDANETHDVISLSEIAFDRDRRHALVAYGLSCSKPGWKCGNGETLVFEKLNGEWKQERRCGYWVSKPSVR